MTLALTGCAERLFFWPLRTEFEDPAGVENVTFETADGLTLHGWFLAPTDGSAPPWPAALHVHGNAGNLSHHLEFSEFLPSHGVAALMFDYRSYGRSARGRLRRQTALRDAHAALDYLLAREDVDASRVGVYGVSLGGAVGISLMASRGEARSMVSLAAFSDWRGIASEKLPGLGYVLIRPGQSPMEDIARFGDRPLLIVHGTGDLIVPVSHGETLERAARSAGVPVETRYVPGGSHNAILREDEACGGVIGAFFERTLRD